jgi:hypothetical protein
MQAQNEVKSETGKAKPHVVRVEMPGGTVRLIGVTDAAAWLGCSRQALTQIARGKVFCTGTLEARAREAFPELFGEKAKG